MQYNQNKKTLISLRSMGYLQTIRHLCDCHSGFFQGYSTLQQRNTAVHRESPCLHNVECQHFREEDEKCSILFLFLLDV